jgi:hypothetical protein
MHKAACCADLAQVVLASHEAKRMDEVGEVVHVCTTQSLLQLRVELPASSKFNQSGIRAVNVFFSTGRVWHSSGLTGFVFFGDQIVP